MNKKILIAVIIVLVSAVSFFIINEMLSYRAVDITLSDKVSQVDFYGDDSEVKYTIKDSQQVRIKKGDYFLVPEGNDIDNTGREVTINDETKNITVDPDFNNTYLSKQAEYYKPEITQRYSNKYPEAMVEYKILSITLFGKANEGGILLVPNDFDEASPERIYRSAIKKIDDKWQIVAGPEIILTLDNSPGADKSLLQKVNSLAF